MKNVSTPLFLCIVCCLSSPLQSQYQYYLNGHLITLTEAKGRVLVGMEEGRELETIQIRSQFDKMQIDGEIDGHYIVTDTELSSNRVEALRKMPGIKFVHPFFNIEAAPLLSYAAELIIQLKRDDKTLLLDFLSDRGWSINREYQFRKGVYIIEKESNISEEYFSMARKLFESGLCAYAEPNFIGESASDYIPNDPQVANQFVISNDGSVYGGGSAGTVGADMRLESAWNVTRGCSDIVIAIIDEGVNLNHPDLMANLITGYDATSANNAGMADAGDSHGSFCAGTAAAVGDNGLGVAGVAYECSIMPVRAWATGDASTAYFADAIDWAWNNGADVLSNSWGWSESQIIKDAIDDAVSLGRNGKGCLFMASSGNSNNGSNLGFPARYLTSIAVGASNACDERKSAAADTTGCNKSSLVPDPDGVSCDGVMCWGSNYGNLLDVVAPGQYVYTTTQTSYGWFQGTSAACPNAAGVAALIFSVNPDLTGPAARDILEKTCRKAGNYTYSQQVGHPNGDWNNEMGYGVVDAQIAVSQALISASAYIQNFSFFSPLNYFFQERYAIHAGEFVNNNAPSGNVNVFNGANVDLRARHFIRLRPGFTAYSGSTLNARIVNFGGCPLVDE